MRLLIVNQIQSGQRCPQVYPFIATTSNMKKFAILAGKDFSLGPTKQSPQQIFSDYDDGSLRLLCASSISSGSNSSNPKSVSDLLTFLTVDLDMKSGITAAATKSGERI